MSDKLQTAAQAAEQLIDWQQKLGGDVVRQQLQTDYPRTNDNIETGNLLSHELTPNLLDSLSRYCKDECVDRSLMFMTTFFILLHRLTDQDDVWIGTRIRLSHGADGRWENDLVLRTDLDGNLSFCEALSRVRDTWEKASDHADVSIEQIKEMLQSEGAQAGEPLFQFMYRYHSNDWVNNEKFTIDLALHIVEQDNTLKLDWQYNGSLYEESTIKGFAERYCNLLWDFVNNPQAKMSEISILIADERRLLFDEWLRTSEDFPADKCFHQLFEEQAERTPDAIAVEFNGQRLTYRELDERSNRLAHYLRGKGVKPETFVGLCVDRSIELIVGLLGILKAGGAYVPLDPSYPVDRLSFMLADTAAPVLIMQEQWIGRVPTQDIEVVRIDGDWNLIAKESSERLVHQSTIDNVAYVIYTSGSTGRPKGVLVTHAGIGNLMTEQVAQLEIGSGFRVLQFNSISFDAFVWELTLSLLTGATLCLTDRETLLGPNFADLLDEKQITTVTVPPTFLSMHEPKEMKYLRHLIVGGEACSKNLVQRWGRGQKFFNVYGPTEATVVSNVYQCSVEEEINPAIGRPLRNVESYVLDKYMQPVPIGVPGELYIGGVCLSRGYLNRPELTQERFIEHPFSEKTGKRIYRTGDLVRWRKDGEIEYIGRIDNQVKVRGHRIELGEVEAVLGDYPGVREAVVIVREDQLDDQRLVAYFTVDEQVDDVMNIRRWLRGKLPPYMMPAAFVCLDAFPMNPNGKIEKSLLPTPNVAQKVEWETGKYRDSLEEEIAKIWCEILQVQQVSAEDNIFDLGAHSLSLTRVASRVKELFQIEMPIQMLFDAPTVPELADLVRVAVKSEKADSLFARHGESAPLSFSQERLWFLDQYLEDQSIYNVQFAFRLEGALNRAALEKSLNEIIRRHDVLRTTFATIDGVAIQVVAPELHLVLNEVDFQECSSTDVLAEVERFTQSECARAFDLKQGPLVRGSLIQYAETGHFLVLIMHHIIVDGWSLGLLVEELKSLYQAFAHHQMSPLPELAIQYSDFAAWQREWMRGDALQQQMDYWKQQLSGELSMLLLPTDHPRPNIQTYRGGQQKIQLPVVLGQALQELSRREGVTIFMTLLAAFKVLLHRYTGQHDLLVGSPIANRNRRELEGLIGFFVNTLVLRTDLSEQLSFRELLHRVREVTVEAYAHQDVPFEKLVEELSPDRSLGYSPLFQIMFVMQNASGDGLGQFQMDDIQVQAFEFDRGMAMFDLTMQVHELNDRLHVSLEYNRDLFESATIKRMLEHFQQLLESAVSQPDQQVVQLPMLSPDERKQLLQEWNLEALDYPAKTFQELFASQVELRPDAVAIEFTDGQLTYRELDVRSNQLARYLRERGVGVETLVGLSFDRSPSMIVGVLSILKAGGAYVPLDPNYPSDRLAYMMEDSQVSVLVTEAKWLHSLPTHSARTILLDSDWEQIAEQSTEPLQHETQLDHAAYVIYTSGSTGRPKGVVVTHSGIGNLMTEHKRSFGVQAGDRVLQFSSISFDAFVWELVMSLLTGATLYLTDRESLLGADFVDMLREKKITAALLPPSFLAMKTPQELPDLRNLIVGGEACTQDLIKRWGEGRNFFNAYGPTESTVCATLYCCNRQEESHPPIGKPIMNTQVYVLDQNLQPVPVGVSGELYLGGVALARGYLNRPELTAERFISDPFSEKRAARLYKTGDLVRWNKAGVIEYLGRTDNQVKVRGHRIELEEIEAALSLCAGIRHAVVTVREDGDKRLVAYVTGEVTTDEVRHLLKEQMPEYMIPSSIVVLEAMPLTSNGKVDRQALPDPALELETAAHEEYLPPVTEVEIMVSEIWAKVLNVAHVSRNHNFFALGGHSLLATQVVSRMLEVLNWNIPVRLLFEADTLAAFCIKCEQQHHEVALSKLPVLQAVESREKLPLSFAQQSLWFLDQFLSDRFVYNMPVLYQLNGMLDTSAFECALNEIVRRHEILRTVFVEVDGIAKQMILPELDLNMACTDLSDLTDPEQRQERLKQVLATGVYHEFDLRNAPLFVVSLVKIGEEEHVLLLNMHHIISDGWSVGALMEELNVLYEAFSQGRPSPFGQLEVQYADFAVWQREWLQGNIKDEQMTYWKQRLGGGLPILQLPTDHPRPAEQTYRGSRETIMISKEITEGLKAIGTREGATLYMTLLAAFKTWLCRYTGEEDILVGSPVANRRFPELEKLIGCFINTLALRTDLSGDLTFNQLLGRIRETVLEAYTYQDVPFEQLVDELSPERNTGYSPLFQVMFVLQNAHGDRRQIGDVKIRPLPVEMDIAKFDLTLSMREHAGGLAAEFEYNSDLFDRETILRWARHFEALLAGVTANPDAQLSRLPLLLEAEMQEMLTKGKGQWQEFERDLCIHQWFEAQVVQTPDAEAVVMKDLRLTYRELNEQANRLAHYLCTFGVAPEVKVGISLERSIEIVIAILATLKAGGAYVPLDPNYPQERVKYALEDSQVAVLLTEEHLLNKLPEHQVPVICLDRDADIIGRQESDNLPCEANADNLAYVIYTSGSTGKPKGVLIPHGNVIRLLKATEHWYGFDEQDVWTLFHSYAFDFSVWEIWGALLYGGKVVVAPYWVSRSPEDFLDLLISEQVTVLNQTPSAFRQLIQAEERKGDVAQPLALRYVIFGGEALELQSLKPWFERHGDERPKLFNMYGITETTVHVTYRPIGWGDVESGTGSVIGAPIPDLQVFVLDQYLQPVPIGVCGEMYVGGAGVARGYLNRPELTNERFIQHPFSTDPDARLYKTGDLARYLADGDLEYLGRVDHQVKVRGFRIELGEIESSLVEHPHVHEAVVLVREYTDGEKRLIGYAVTDLDQQLTPRELREHLLQSLPEFMIPAAFVILKSLPLTANGKVDHRALPSPEENRPEQMRTYTAPRNEVEEKLASILTKVLKAERIGIHDNYFELGGDSILSIQVLAEARKQGIQFTLQDLFRHQSIFELTASGVLILVDREMEKQTPFSLITEAERKQLPSNLENAYPLTQLQLGMLFHSEKEAQQAIYHNVSLHHLRAPFDQDSMERALAVLVTRHPILRTSFALTGYREPLQLVHRHLVIPFEVYDLRDLPAGEREQALDRWFDAELKRPFDWNCPPMLRVSMHRMDEETFQFGLTEHHAILDGWSVASLLTEIFVTYMSFVKGETPDSEALQSQFHKYVKLEQTALRSEETKTYWQQTLQGFTFTQLPRIEGRDRTKPSQMHLTRIEVPREVSHGLKLMAQQANVPLKSVLLAAHIRVLNVLGAQSDVLTGLVTNGRIEEVDGERVLGLFLNTLPLRLELAGGTWQELVQTVFATERELLPHRRYPMAQIQQDLGGQQLFETAFNYTHFHVYETLSGIPDVEILGERSLADSSFVFAVEFGLDSQNAEVQLYLRWNEAELTPEQAARFGSYYQNVLEQIASDPTGRYEIHSVISADEQHQILVEWNETSVEYPKVELLHHLFEQQVERTPDDLAVSFEGCEGLTYRQLNEQSNRLAHRLQKQGVGPNVLVGVCMERSLEMVISLYAILKSGGAYLPLDPFLPAERFAFIVEEAQVSVLLSQSHLHDKLPAYGAEVIHLDLEATWAKLADESVGNLVTATTSKDTAYVIYTSGSTGKPKGVMVPHRGIINRLLWMQAEYKLTALDRVLQKTPFTFDVSVWEFFWPLFSGACLIVAKPEGHQDSAYLVELIREQGITTLHFVPSMLQIFVEESQVQTCTSLRLVFCSGEALPFELQERFFEISQAQLHNLYGPTEASVDVTYWSCEPNGDRKFVPIGRPVANTNLYILDPFLQPVPAGVAGELHISGIQVANGYYKRPELTAERFIADPFSAMLGASMYKTGDLAKWLPDGTIQYLGRIDNQVKIRGLRIELGEIEAVLGSCSGVREAVVTVWEVVPGDQRLVAYLTADEQATVTDLELRQQLKAQLPDYMVPSIFIWLEAMPLSPNGKVDRRALPAPVSDLIPAMNEYEAPGNETEELLAGIWQQVLCRDCVGRNDHFFELGGHSLLAMQVLYKLREIYSLPLPIGLLFEKPTLALLAAEVERLIAESVRQTEQPMKRQADGEDALRLLEELELTDEEVELLLQKALLEAEDAQ